MIAYHIKKKKPVTSAGYLSAKLLEGLAYLQFQIWLSIINQIQIPKQKSILVAKTTCEKTNKKNPFLLVFFSASKLSLNTSVLNKRKLKWWLRPVSICGCGRHNRKFNRASPSQQFTPTRKSQGLAWEFNRFLESLVLWQWRKGQACGITTQWPSLEHNMISCNFLGWQV